MMDKILKDKEQNGMGRLWNFRPVFTFALFLIFGILFSYLRIVEEKNSGWLLALVFALSAVTFFRSSRKFRCAIYIAVFLSAFFIGNLSFALTVDNYRSQPKYNGDYVVSGTVVDKSITDNGGEITLTDLTVDGISQKGKMSVRLAYSDFYALEYCDRVTMELSVSPSNSVEGSYGFRAEGIADNELYQGANVTSYTVDGRDFRLGVYLRGEIKSTLSLMSGEESTAVASAILLGDTSGIEKDLLENFRYGGIAHIFAVSGLHIGSLFAACLFLFHRSRMPAPIKFVIVFAVLLTYGAICGYSASVVRAIVTCLTLYACSLIGLKADTLENLSLAAVIVLLAYPTLLFGVGFQLSFSACLGILLLTRPMEKGGQKLALGVVDVVRYRVLHRPRPEPVDMFRGNTSPEPLYVQWLKKVISFFAVTISAQIATAPVLYSAFGYLSVWSLLLNCIFVPLLSVCFSPMLLLTALAAILPDGIAVYLLFVLETVLSIIVLPFHLSDFSSGNINSVQLSAPAIISYYLAVVFCSDKINVGKVCKALIALGFATVFFVCVLAVC